LLDSISLSVSSSLPLQLWVHGQEHDRTCLRFSPRICTTEQLQRWLSVLDLNLTSSAHKFRLLISLLLAGAILQQALSTIVDISPQTATQQDGGAFSVYGTEFVPGECG